MADEQKQVSLERIYVKDISFESPKAPDVFRKEWKPKINLDLNTRHNDLGDNHHEVILSLTITASDDEGTVLFLAEAQQAGVFLIQGLAGEEFART
ncbi:MAG: protein-export chaperone SecB, partial [Pseudomonadales bacterium]